MKVRISMLVVTILFSSSSILWGKLLPREQRKIEMEYDTTNESSKAQGIVRRNLAKIVHKDAFTLDDNKEHVIVFQLNSQPCTAFPYLNKPWDMTASVEIKFENKSAKVVIDDLIVSFESTRHRDDFVAALFKSDERKPASSADLDKIDKECISPIIDRVFEGS